MFECLHCGNETTHEIHRTSGTRVCKRDNSQDPRGWYYFAFCEHCDWIHREEFTALWQTYPDRLINADERYDSSQEAIDALC